jgi:hypothetical protein
MMTDMEIMGRSPSLRLAGRLMLAGQLSYILVTQFHAGGDANDHAAIFAHYAEDGVWSPVHVGQFAGMALLVTGLLAFAFALDHERFQTKWLSQCGAAAAVAALALYAGLQAVDGVALKQTVMAWANAPESEKAASFATAEGIRWLEWGLRSYQDYMLGLAILLLAFVLAGTRSAPRWIAVLMILSALTCFAQGWIVGKEGFSWSESIAIVASWVVSLVWMTWLSIFSRHNEIDRVGRRSGPASAKRA